MKRVVIFCLGLVFILLFGKVISQECENECLYQQAILSGDANNCERVFDGWEKNCYINFSVGKNKEIFCYQMNNSDRCFYNLGKANNNNSLCEKILDKKLKNDCKNYNFKENNHNGYLNILKGLLYLAPYILVLIFSIIQFSKKFRDKHLLLSNAGLVFVPLIFLTSNFLSLYSLLKIDGQYLFGIIPLLLIMGIVILKIFRFNRVDKIFMHIFYIATIVFFILNLLTLGIFGMFGIIILSFETILFFIAYIEWVFVTLTLTLLNNYERKRPMKYERSWLIKLICVLGFIGFPLSVINFFLYLFVPIRTLEFFFMGTIIPNPIVSLIFALPFLFSFILLWRMKRLGLILYIFLIIINFGVSFLISFGDFLKIVGLSVSLIFSTGLVAILIYQFHKAYSTKKLIS